MFEDNAESAVQAGALWDNACPPQDLLPCPISDQELGSNLRMAQLEKFRLPRDEEDYALKALRELGKVYQQGGQEFGLNQDTESRGVEYKSG